MDFSSAYSPYSNFRASLYHLLEDEMPFLLLPAIDDKPMPISPPESEPEPDPEIIDLRSGRFEEKNKRSKRKRPTEMQKLIDRNTGKTPEFAKSKRCEYRAVSGNRCVDPVAGFGLFCSKHCGKKIKLV